VEAHVTVPIVLTDSTIVCDSYKDISLSAGQDFHDVIVDISLNDGQDFHDTTQQFRFYTSPDVTRTGCLGAKKGCLVEGPTDGGNPLQVIGRGFNRYVDYERARCRFSYEGGFFYGQIAFSIHADGPCAEVQDSAGNSYPEYSGCTQGMDGGSIALDGMSLYCVTPLAKTQSKIVTNVAIALNGVDYRTSDASLYSYYPQTVETIKPAGGVFTEATSITVTGFFFPGFDGLQRSARCKFGVGDDVALQTVPSILDAQNGIIVCASPPRADSAFITEAGGCEDEPSTAGCLDVPFSVALNTVRRAHHDTAAARRRPTPPRRLACSPVAPTVRPAFSCPPFPPPLPCLPRWTLSPRATPTPTRR
jgi:hypothetical protein